MMFTSTTPISDMTNAQLYTLWKRAVALYLPLAHKRRLNGPSMDAYAEVLATIDMLDEEFAARKLTYPELRSSVC